MPRSRSKKSSRSRKTKSNKSRSCRRNSRPRSRSRKSNKFVRYAKKYAKCCRQNRSRGLKSCSGNNFVGASRFYGVNDLSDCSSIIGDSYSYKSPSVLSIQNAPSVPSSPSVPFAPKFDYKYYTPSTKPLGTSLKELSCEKLSKKFCSLGNNCVYPEKLQRCMSRDDYDHALDQPCDTLQKYTIKLRDDCEWDEINNIGRSKSSQSSQASQSSQSQLLLM